MSSNNEFHVTSCDAVKGHICMNLHDESSDLEKLKSSRDKVNWEIIEDRVRLLRRFDILSKRWTGRLPNLRDVFRPEEIDWLLTESICGRYTVRRQGERLIEFVARTGYRDEPELDEDGEPMVRRNTPIHDLALLKHGNWRAGIRELFKIYDRFDVNYIHECGLSHLHVACQINCCDAVSRFLELGQDPNFIVHTTRDAPLHFAAYYNCKEVTELLLKKGADPNLANRERHVPLHLICQSDNQGDLVEMLLDASREQRHEVQIDARDKYGRTPLQVAVLRRNENLVRVLLRSGADPNAADENGTTCLHIICRYDHDDPDMTRAFVETSHENFKMVRMDIEDVFGRTPLHLAVINIKPKTLDVLLDLGVDLSDFVLPTTSYYGPRTGMRTYRRLKFIRRLSVDFDDVAASLLENGFRADESSFARVATNYSTRHG